VNEFNTFFRIFTYDFKITVLFRIDGSIFGNSEINVVLPKSVNHVYCPVEVSKMEKWWK